MENVRTSGAQSTLALALYYTFKVIPMLIGGMSIYLGYRLFILGVTGQASLSVDSKSVSGQLLNAAPGLFFAVGGIVANIASVLKGVKIHFVKDGPFREEIANYVFADKLPQKKWNGPGEQA